MELPLSITGTLQVVDAASTTTIALSENDFHLENFARTIIKAISGLESGHIEEVHFGNGATTITETGGLLYKTPNVTGASASLYNDLTYKVINNKSSNFTSDKNENYIKYEQIPGSNATRIVIHFTLGYAEPAFTTDANKAVSELKYSAVDDILSTDKFTFDEVSLMAVDHVSGEKILLTHWISKPIDKIINRAMEFIYTIDLQLSKA